MAGQTEQQPGYVAAQTGSQPSAQAKTPKPPRSLSASSSSKPLIIGFAGVLLTAAAIGGFVMTQSASPPPAAPQISAMASVATAPVAAAPIYTAPTYVAPTIAPVVTPAAPPAVAFAPPPVANPAPAPLSAPDQCRVGQMRTLSLNISATLKGEAGNVVRIRSDSFVSPPILVTLNGQIVTVPVSPGSSSVTIMGEQRQGGWTITPLDGAELINENHIDDHRDSFSYRLPTPRC
jgi:hypothetical protein